MENAKDNLQNTVAKSNNKDDIYNIDEELEQKFEELFGDKSEVENPKKDEVASSSRQKAMLIAEQNFVNKMYLSQRVEEKGKETHHKISRYSAQRYCSNILFQYKKMTLDRFLVGKHFSFPIREDIVTTVFCIEAVPDFTTMTSSFQVLDLKYTDNDNFRTFYAESPPAHGTDLLILHFDRKNKRIIVNTAILQRGEVRICKKPFFMSPNFRIQKGADFISTLNPIAFDVEKNGITESKEKCAKTYPAKTENSGIVIIDPDTGLPVKREIYYDEANAQFKALISLNPYHSYFCFQIRRKNVLTNKSDTNSTPLSVYKKGLYLYRGDYNFPKDVYSAVDYLLEDDSSESNYLLAEIFRNSEEYKNAEIYRDYLTKAADNQFLPAIIDLILSILFQDISSYTLEEWVDKLYKFDVNDQSEIYGVYQFLLGYLLERNARDSVSVEKAFSYYKNSARNLYQPATVRLGISDNDFEGDDENLLSKFKESVNLSDGTIEYCLGCILLYGLDVIERQEEGLKLLIKSFSLGNISALETLYEEYNNADNPFFDETIALHYLELLCKIDNSKDNTLANWYLNGKGCEVNEENDKKAFDLLNTHIDSGNSTILNNLAWMYKNGRGCQTDYEKARILFEKASRLGSKVSFYHLGELYKNGLGVEQDDKKAYYYYQIAAEKGHKKSAEIIEKVNNKPMLSESEESSALQSNQLGLIIDQLHSDVSNGFSAISNQLENLESIKTKIQSVECGVSEINDRTQSIEAILKSILETQKSISDEKIAFSRMLGSEIDDETQYMSFINSIATRMNNALYQSGNASVDFEEAALKGLFGQYWDTLDVFTRKALVSARVFLANCSSVSYSGLDYSGVCISSCSALEQELKLRFFTGYQEYLKRLFKDDYTKWPQTMKYRQKDGSYIANTNFTIGSLPYIFGSKKRDDKTGERSKINISSEEKGLLNEYIKTILNNPKESIQVFFDGYDSGTCFLDRCEDVRCIYRNTAAHTKTLSLETATACCREVIGGETAAETVGQVQGLIYDLVRLTRLPNNLF